MSFHRVATYFWAINPVTLHFFHFSEALAAVPVRTNRLRSSMVHPNGPFLNNIFRKKSLLYLKENDEDRENDVAKNDKNSNNFLENIRKRNLYQEGVRESYESFGILAPLAKTVDAQTGGWGLGYADTTPYDDKSVVGILFLATNFFYFWAGSNLFASGNYPLSFAIDIAGVVSLFYHWSQIHYGPNRDEVRMSLLADYITAFIAINFTFIELVQLYFNISSSTGRTGELPLDCIVLGVAGVLCLIGSWGFEYGVPYLFLHGMWHIFSALCTSAVGSKLMDP